MEKDPTGIHVKRRDFIKTTALASVVATLPGTNLIAQETKIALKPSPQGKKRKLLFLTETPAPYEKLIASIKAIKEFEISVSTVQTNYQKIQEIMQVIQSTDPDIILICLPRVTTSSGGIPALFGDINVPVILIPVNPDLIMLEADMAAAFRLKGVNVMLSNSEAHAVELIKVAAAPRILEGKRAVIYGRAFDSSSVPARNLNAEDVFRRTGIRLEYRPIELLKEQLASVDEAIARKEMERWKKEAVQVIEPDDKAILECSKVYVLLRSILEKEGFSGISIDCLSFSFTNPNLLPLPCLAFTRLRDDGFAVPCEADVCGMITSMVLQEISRKPSYLCNVSGVNSEKSTTVLRHCVAPLKMMGSEAKPLSYNLRDYHGMGRGVTPEVSLPVGVETTLGCFSKDLKDFSLWPGRTIARVKDTDRPSFSNLPPNATKEMKNMRMFCSNHAEMKIKDVDRFLQSIAGCHAVMVAGNYAKALRNAMLRMNVNIIGPSDLDAPKA